MSANHRHEKHRIEGRYSDADLRPQGLLMGSGKVREAWAGVSVTYAWGRPYSAPARTTANRMEISFSAHRNVEMEVDGRLIEVDIPAGGMFALGNQEVDFLRRHEFGDWLEVRISNPIIDSFRRWHPEALGPRPTFDGKRRVSLEANLQMLSLAHIVRRGCLGTSSLSDIEADSLAHRLVASMATPLETPERRNPLTKSKLDEIFEFVEAGLDRRISLGDLAEIAAISPFHFSRLFKDMTGLPPYEYVKTRRLERAKQLLLSSPLTVREIGWSLGMDNLSHFRRKFAEQFGIRPSDLRPTRVRPHNEVRGANHAL